MINLFYVESFFHLLVVEQIIETKKISLDSCYFITERGTALPKQYLGRLLYDGSNTGIVDRIKLYYKRQLKLKSRLGKEEICAYLPFQYYVPSKRYFAKYFFYEEGFSAYGQRVFVADKERRKKGILKRLLITLTLPFADKTVKGIIAGVTCDSIQLFKTELYRLSDDAYKELEGHRLIEVKTIGIKYMEPSFSSDIYNSVIVVADRISSQGRPFDEEKYLRLLKKTISKVYKEPKPLYVKLHPADFKNKDASKRVLESLSEFSPTIIEDNLENLAICNQNNTFVGTNSTVLYYAPILGDSNTSISFARLLSETDSKYEEFLQGWGGVVKFIELFSNQVKCL